MRRSPATTSRHNLPVYPNLGGRYGPDPNNAGLNLGLSDYDATHTLIASGIWELPSPLKKGSAVLRQILNV